MAKVFAAFANGVWFKAERADLGQYDPEQSNEDEMCAGCVFFGRGYRACRAAEIAAQEAGLPDCESKGRDPGYRYVRDPSEGRQMDLIESAP